MTCPQVGSHPVQPDQAPQPEVIVGGSAVEEAFALQRCQMSVMASQITDNSTVFQQISYKHAIKGQNLNTTGPVLAALRGMFDGYGSDTVHNFPASLHRLTQPQIIEA